MPISREMTQTLTLTYFITKNHVSGGFKCCFTVLCWLCFFILQAEYQQYIQAWQESVQMKKEHQHNKQILQ